MTGVERLAVYGTLAPGRPNAHVLADVPGRWIVGTVRGVLCAAGWGAELGFPGVVLDPHGPLVEVHVLESAVLTDHWARLDAFEGPGHRRMFTIVRTSTGGEIAAQIYTLADG